MKLLIKKVHIYAMEGWSGGMEKNMSILNNDEIPVGLSMALAENLHAMERFSNMNETEQQDFISRSRAVGSKQEMRSLVAGLDSMN